VKQSVVEWLTAHARPTKESSFELFASAVDVINQAQHKESKSFLPQSLTNSLELKKTWTDEAGIIWTDSLIDGTHLVSILIMAGSILRKDKDMAYRKTSDVLLRMMISPAHGVTAILDGLFGNLGVRDEWARRLLQ
jgi:hypothetical protein